MGWAAVIETSLSGISGMLLVYSLSRWSFISHGSFLTLYQQLMSARIDWSANVVNVENVNSPDSFAMPSTWEEFHIAILDILMRATLPSSSRY